MKRKLLRKRALLPAVAALVLVGGAVGAWFVVQSAGDGGRAKLGELATPTVTNVTPSTGSCFPGQSCSLSVTINNPNPQALSLASVDWTNPTLTVEKPIGTSITGACSLAQFVVSDPLTGLDVNVPPGSSTVEVPGAFLLLESAPAACMGAYVTVIGNNHVWTFAAGS